MYIYHYLYDWTVREIIDPDLAKALIYRVGPMDLSSDNIC